MPEESSTLEDLQDLYSRDELRALLRRRSDCRELFIPQLYQDLNLVAGTMEMSANCYPRSNFNETSLTKQIVDRLQFCGYAIGAETDSRGHVDITVTSHRKSIIWLGEAKIHSDYEWLHHGLQQLVQRYTTGRHDDAGMLIYIYNKDAGSVLDEWSRRVAAENLCDLIELPSARQRTGFSSKHKHPAWGNPVTVQHLGVALYFQPPV